MVAASSCRLYLITPLLSGADLDAFAPSFAEALKSGDVASALLRVAPGAEGDAKRIVQRIVETASRHDVATLVENDARFAVRAGADGVHVSKPGAEFADALASLHPDRIVGAGGLRTRDDAMNAGEVGADYVMFGEPRPDGFTPPLAETTERVAWWADIFETACVGYAQTLEAVAILREAGADFVALGDAVWRAPSPGAAIARALTLMRTSGAQP